MAATKDVQDVIDAAVSRNQMNDEDILAGDAEMINLVSRVQQSKFVKAAQMNPDYFGKQETVTLNGSKEADFSGMTNSMAFISRVEIANVGSSGYASGDKVNIVTTDEQDVEMAPRMFKQMDKLAPVGSDLSGVTSVLIYLSFLPATMNSAVAPNTIALDMPDEYFDALVAELALYLAVKDNRDAEEKGVLGNEIKETESVFLAAVGGFTYTTDVFKR